MASWVWTSWGWIQNKKILFLLKCFFFFSKVEYFAKSDESNQQKLILHKLTKVDETAGADAAGEGVKSG